jgi:hypothetical protein
MRKPTDHPIFPVVRTDWASFFSIKVEVPEDFLVAPDDPPPQRRHCIELMLKDAEPSKAT